MMESRNKVTTTTHRTTACEACKKRRTKCQGHPTCFKCREFQTDCIFQPQQDKRKKSALREATDQIDHLNRLIEDITQAFESDDRPRLERLVAQHKDGRSGHLRQGGNGDDAKRSVISKKRRGVDLVSVSDETFHHLQKQRRKLANIHEALENCDEVSLPLLLDGIWKGFTVDTALSIDATVPWKAPAMTLHRMQEIMASGLAKQPGLLHKEPPYRVYNVGRWTSVVTDEIASHLLSIYFTWEIWYVLDAKMFLRDLNAGRTEFCSPLLVNAVLCIACNYSYDIGKPWDRSEERSIANALFAEVERLWQLEKTQICVTTVQASIVVGLLYCGSGKDKVGCGYVEYGARMAHHLGLHQWSSHAYLQDPEEDMERTRAYKVIAWGVFDAQGSTTQLCRKKPVWRDPPTTSFSEQEAAVADENRFWTPYPFTSPIQRDLLHTRIWASSELLTIANDIAAFVVEVPDGPLQMVTWQAGANLHDRLLFFKACLPAELHLNWNKTPQNICMYLHYYSTVINLCEVFDSRPLDSAFCDDPEKFPSFVPAQSVSDAMNSMGSLILLYRACHGWKSLPCMMEHYFCLTGVHAASRIQTSERWSSILGACVSGLWHMSLGWRLTRPFLRMIQVILTTAKHDQSLLPVEVVKIFEELNAKVWNMTEVASLSADYVVHQVPHELVPKDKPVQRARTEGIENLILSLEQSRI